MKSLELIIERVILSSRWLLVVFYIGLGWRLPSMPCPSAISS
ncbi:UNVERIFIED_ORG: putative membrane protein YqhA [Rhizobium esperanzae]